MLRSIATCLTLLMFGGLASADRRPERREDHRDQRHEERHDQRHDERPVVRDHRSDERDRGPVVRDHRNDQPARVNRPAQRSDRRVLTRRPVYVSNGRYVFAGGVTRTYVRPDVRVRYYNVRVRPQYVVENYTAVPGYVWVRGEWTWGGNEWRWGDGYYAPDPQYLNYYDDGSYDYSLNISIGG